MNKLLLLALLFFGCTAIAKDTFEVGAGSLTYHIFDPNNYPNQISHGLILNPLAYYKYTKEDVVAYESYSVFTGTNSVSSAIIGGMYSFGALSGPLNLGVAIGGYKQDDSSFTKYRILPPADDINGYVFLAGFEGSYKLMLDNRNFIKYNMMVFPNLVNWTIGVGGYLD